MLTPVWRDQNIYQQDHSWYTMAITFVGYSSGEKRMSMVLEMPVMTTSAAERAQLLPERLHAAYQDLFALLKQQYRFADDAHIFAFLRQHSHLIPVKQEGWSAVSQIFL